MSFETAIGVDSYRRVGAQGFLFADDAPVVRSFGKSGPADGVMFDASETEDIVIVRPAPVRDSDSMRRITAMKNASAVRRIPEQLPVGRIPTQIGHGKLVGKKLAWRPGDPFGQTVRQYAPEFVWRRMLASACITAACGLLAVWLLQTIFA